MAIHRHLDTKNDTTRSKSQRSNGWIKVLTLLHKFILMVQRHTVMTSGPKVDSGGKGRGETQHNLINLWYQYVCIYVKSMIIRKKGCYRKWELKRDAVQFHLKRKKGGKHHWWISCSSLCCLFCGCRLLFSFVTCWSNTKGLKGQIQVREIASIPLDQILPCSLRHWQWYHVSLRKHQRWVKACYHKIRSDTKTFISTTISSEETK